ADLVRRAMSKKKHSVMDAERQNFVYGNEAEHVEGCAKKGISPEIANRIFDQMVAFAEYAFNKSHAAAYAVVAYETAWLKYYYPAEFLAALMTSFVENSSKVSEYVYTCRKMRIDILPPDINRGRGEFSVQGGKIRYGLNAIKGIGKGVVEAIVSEREQNGPFRDARDFMLRLTQKEVNKKTLENFIKSGAFDSFGHTRRQEMSYYPILLDEVEKTRKDSLSGQFSLFDFTELKADNAASAMDRYPDVGEYEKEQLLEFEKEVLGIYVSGHPLEAYAGLFSKNVTNSSADFQVDEETGSAEAEDGARAVIGGIITDKTVKTTKNNQMMAFLTVEDMIGTLEVLVFPKDYEKYRADLNVDARVLIAGRVSIGEDPKGKLILERETLFERVPKELWLQFADRRAYEEQFGPLMERLASYDGNDTVVVYLKDTRLWKRMPSRYSVGIAEGAAEAAESVLGRKNVGIKYGTAVL
ncbi:MAG: DNA polymerase III subunit alpha, partial [Lachnospiraceae bacterium]|nr:DNA polymerase III subunit alpha [Lachnospiraceae bacterium]